MAEDVTGGIASDANDSGRQPIVIQNIERPSRGRGWVVRLLLIALAISVMVNFSFLATQQEYYSAATGPAERFHSGDRKASDKIAVIEVSGTIMPPFTERILDSIKQAKEDDQVKGVLLSVDSPGGLVADSHQIYHRLVELRETKPIYVAMKRIAASGGVYVAMGAGKDAKIFAEPTTWTGSIGVIIPRYDLQELGRKIGVSSDPLKTGEYKDSLNPFRELSEGERSVWDAIMNESFERFINVIANNRAKLDFDGVKKLATGQVYTAIDAQQNGLIDEIGYEDDAIEALKTKLGLDEVRVVSYLHPVSVMDLLLGSAEAKQPANEWQRFIDATVPRAMYLCSWAPGIPTL